MFYDAFVRRFVYLSVVCYRDNSKISRRRIYMNCFGGVQHVTSNK